jgi:allantoin racemase
MGDEVRRVLVLNPNSSRSVTDVIRQATEEAGLTRVRFEVDQLDEGPPVLETEEDDIKVTPLVVDYVSRRRDEFDAFVIACHGDPGVAACREFSPHVFGIGETSFLVACASAERFGVLTLGSGLVDVKWRQVERAGLRSRCVAVEPTETGVLHGVEADLDLEPYLRAGRTALDRGAQALVLGCAGMVNVCRALQEALHVPIIEPVMATCLVAANIPASGAGAAAAGPGGVRRSDASIWSA